MRFNFDTDWFNNNKWVKVTDLNSPSENYLFLNVMVNFVIVNQKLIGSALHIEKNQTIHLCFATVVQSDYISFCSSEHCLTFI